MACPRAPKRHPDIPRDATWSYGDNIGEWMSGAVVKKALHGHVRFFRPDGSLCEEQWMKHGAGTYKRYHPDGTLSQEGFMHDGKREGVCSWFRSKKPTPELTLDPSKAANVKSSTSHFVEGESRTLWTHYRDWQGREVAPTGELAPKRPASVPAEAYWIQREGDDKLMWASGSIRIPSLENAGLWRWWTRTGKVDCVEYYVAGKCVAGVDYPGGRGPKARRLAPSPLFAAAKAGDSEAVNACRALGLDRTDGKPSLLRKWRDGETVYEEEILSDGFVERAFHPNGAQRAERLSRKGVLVKERWFDPSGKCLAEVTPANEVIDNEPVERWRALEPGGRTRAEGFVLAGFSGEPVGAWTVFDKGKRLGKVDFELSVPRQEDLGELAASLHDWSKVKWPPALRDVDKVNWARQKTWFYDGDDLPFYLRGLLIGNPIGFRMAIAKLWEPIFHQETVCPATATTFDFMVRILPFVKSKELEEALLEFLAEIASSKSHRKVDAEIRRTVVKHADLWRKHSPSPHAAVLLTMTGGAARRKS